MLPEPTQERGGGKTTEEEDIEEIRRIVGKLKNGKMMGIDRISNEVEIWGKRGNSVGLGDV